MKLGMILKKVMLREKTREKGWMEAYAFTGTLEECIAEAEKILLDLDVCEYGICELDFAHPFPQMTLEEANKILDF